MRLNGTFLGLAWASQRLIGVFKRLAGASLSQFLENKSQYWPCGAKKRVDTAKNIKAERTEGAME